MLSNRVRQKSCPLRDHGHHAGEAKEMMKGFERQASEERGKVAVRRDLEGRKKGVG